MILMCPCCDLNYNRNIAELNDQKFDLIRIRLAIMRIFCEPGKDILNIFLYHIINFCKNIDMIINIMNIVVLIFLY